MAVSAASAYGACREEFLLEYARVVTDRGLDANDSHGHSLAQHGNTAVALAAYHGYVRLLGYLLDVGSSLDSNGMYGNAVEAAVRNGQHEALELLLRTRPDDVALLFANDRFSLILRRAIYKDDVESVRILIKKGPCKPTMSDRHMMSMRNLGKDRTHVWPVLQQLYPTLHNVVGWTKPLHWSFPTADRQALNLLWHTVGCCGNVFPGEVWLLVFSFTGRGWFKRDDSETNL
jgi:hypothetical protein